MMNFVNGWFSLLVLLLPVPALLAGVIPQPREIAFRGGTYLAPAGFFDTAAEKWTRDASLPPEGYAVEVSSNGVAISAADAAGAFYAVETLKQLSPVNSRGLSHRQLLELRRSVCAETPLNPHVNRQTVELVEAIKGSYGGDTWAIPCCTIRDWPAYRWRALMLDEGRHFFGKEYVLSLLDRMAQHKLNVFHWHLTEDQGWRLDLPGLHELVEYGAKRPRSVAYRTPVAYPKGFNEPSTYFENDEPYGPYFYTVEDVKEILASAKARHIRVMPEIEFPGHARALLAAHPEFSCRGESIGRTPRTTWGVEKDVICAANEDAVRYLERVLDAVCDLFPDADVIHIGGDECFCERWKTCPRCQALKAKEGFATERDLQSRLTLHFADYLKAKGRRIMGWDGLLTGKPLDVKTTQVHFRMPRPGCRVKNAAGAAELGHDIALIETPYAYFDLGQDLDEDPYYYRPWSKNVRLDAVYACDPANGIPDAVLHHVMGAEGTLWTEYVFDRRDAEWKTWPRACALAEALWCGRAKPGYEDFCARLVPHRRRMIREGLNVAPLPGRGTVSLFGADGGFRP